MKFSIKKFLKWFSISFVVLIGLLIAAPFIFKDKIIAKLKETINQEVNATIDWKDADLSFISTFPYFTLELNGLSVEGIDEFKGVHLAKVETILLSLNLQSVFNGNYSVEKLGLMGADLNVLVLENGKANYDIAKPSDEVEEETTEESAPFSFKLSKYYLENSTVTYDDKSLGVMMALKGLNHTGKGVFEGDIYDLKTQTNAESVSLGYEGVNYLSKALTDLKCDIEMNLAEWLFTFKENDIQLNEIHMGIDGWFKMAEEFYEMDLSFVSKDNTFKSLLSLIPGAYTPDFGEVKTDGKLSFDGKIFGKYSETEYPGMKLKLNVDNAYFQYPDLPAKMEKIFIDTHIDFPGGTNFDKLVLDVKNFQVEFLDNTLKASLYTTNTETDPYIKSQIMANVDLEKLLQVIPMEEGDNLNGILTSDVILEGNYSAIEKENYQDFKAEGNIRLQKMNYASKTMPYTFAIDSMLFKFSPAQLNLAGLSTKIGNSDVYAAGTIDNYLAYFLKDENLTGNFTVKSNYMNLDELMGEEETSTTEETTSSDSTETYEVIPVPKNITFSLNTNIETLVFDSIPLKNVRGVVSTNDGIATLKNVGMEVFEGSILMNGEYNTQNIEKPSIAFDYDIKNLDINKSAHYFNTVEKLAPIAKSCQGKFSSTLTMNADLGKDMMPIYNTMTGKGNFKTKEMVVKDFKPLTKLADATGISKLREQKFSDLNINFAFRDGKIFVEPFDVKMGNISAKIDGTTSFEQEIDYNINMVIPKSELGALASVSNQATSALSSLTGKTINTSENLNLKVKMIGTVSDPKITTDLKDQGKSVVTQAVDSVKAIVKEKIDEKIDEGKEKVNAEINKLLADAQTQADKIRAEGKTTADKIRSEGKNAANEVRKEAQKQADQLMKEAGNNFVKKETAKIAGQKLMDEAEKKAKAIEAEADKKAVATENEANKRADKVMEDANKKADELRAKGNM
ncbi:MAG: AsmA-like C-terminal region-containing protein [Bacteroidia bacterium]